MGERELIEAFGPLSRSLLWDVQRRAYEELGPVAWQSGTVPQYATSNPSFAATYSQVLLGFLRDCQARDDHDPTAPIHIVELGAGPGRFGYHLLTDLLDRRHHSRLRDVPVRYVLTDLAEANVEFWLGHPHLAPLLDAGLLDVARFDVAADEVVELRRSGDVLAPGSLANPMAILANYVFDSIPQDVVRVVGGELVAVAAAATSTQPEPDLDDPDLAGRLQLAYQDAPFDADELDLDPAAVAVLDGYRRLGETVPLLVPTTALRCLRRVGAWSGDRLLLLAADKGFTEDATLLDADEPEVVTHGPAFSLTVDLGILGGWFEARGGRWLRIERSSRLHVSAALLGLDGDGTRGGAVETEGAYRHAVEEQDPADFYTAVLEREEPETDVDRFLALVRLTRGDHEVILHHLVGLGALVADADETQLAEVRRTLALVWDRYFPIGEDTDLPYYLAMAAYRLGDLPAAIEMLHHSLEIYGPTGWTLYNLAQCLIATGDRDAADALAAQAEQFEESAEAAASLRATL